MIKLEVEIPNGYEIDIENSDLSIGKIVFKELSDYNKTWNDLIGTRAPDGSVYISSFSKINPFSSKIDYEEKNIFIDEQTAKAALAMAQISMLMPWYGGVITTEEWKDASTPKYTIGKYAAEIMKDLVYVRHYPLAFHTEEQRDKFLKNNRQLVKEFLMID